MPNVFAWCLLYTNTKYQHAFVWILNKTENKEFPFHFLVAHLHDFDYGFYIKIVARSRNTWFTNTTIIHRLWHIWLEPNILFVHGVAAAVAAPRAFVQRTWFSLLISWCNSGISKRHSHTAAPCVAEKRFMFCWAQRMGLCCMDDGCGGREPLTYPLYGWRRENNSSRYSKHLPGGASIACGVAGVIGTHKINFITLTRLHAGSTANGAKHYYV